MPLWPQASRRTFLQTAVASLAAGAASRPSAAEGPSNAGEVEWLADVQRPPAEFPAPEKPLAPVLVDADGGPITERAQWEKRRTLLRQAWLEFLGPLPERARPPSPRVLEEERVGNVLRQRLAYETETGETTEAYLLRPAEKAGRLPGVVVFHSTVDICHRQPAGLGGEPALHFGLELAKRGCVALCPRNFLWPETGRIAAQPQAERFLQRHPRTKGMGKMLHDGFVAVDLLAARDDVESGRLGAVGHSLGAKEVLYLAACDERLRCAVSSEGGVGTKFSNWNAPWYLGPTIDEPTFAREHHELLALCAPRALLLVGGNSADGDRSWPYIEAALPVYRLYGAPPRLGLLNHGAGHTLPAAAAARVYAWLAAYL